MRVGGLWRRGDGELEAGAVDDAGGHRDLQLVTQQLGAAAARSARTARSTISPRPPQSRQVQRTGTSSGTVAPSRASRDDSWIAALQRARALVGEERAADAIDAPAPPTESR